MTDNVAVLQGYTKEIWASCPHFEGPLLIKPDTDLDSMFKAWDMDNQEFIRVNGWLWTFEEIEAPKQTEITPCIRVCSYCDKTGETVGYVVVQEFGFARAKLATFEAQPTIKLSRCTVRDFVRAHEQATRYAEKILTEC